MVAPRAVSVIGFKDAGKTRVVEVLVAELTRRGHRVGTLKHTAEDVSLDKPGTDTWRHAEAGAVASAILSDKRTAIFLKRMMSLQRAADSLGEIDYIVLEGFKTLDVAPRIIVPRTQEDVRDLSMGIEILAVDVDGKIDSAGEVPVIRLGDAVKLADIVEARAYPLLGGLDCKACGYPTCGEMGKAILAENAKAERCVNYNSDVVLKVDDSAVALNSFIQSALANVVLGFLKTLKGAEEPHNVKIEFGVRRND
jgi:molybdopterin-guanine dinucleotide biosynthesis protein B